MNKNKNLESKISWSVFGDNVYALFEQENHRWGISGQVAWFAMDSNVVCGK